MGHAIGVGVVVESAGSLADQSHTGLTRTDKCISSYLNSKEFLTYSVGVSRYMYIQEQRQEVTQIYM